MRRVALLLLFLSGCNGEPPPSVNISGEELVGIKLEDSRVSAFLGVPFAAPPLGELRWSAPRPHRPTATRRNVVAFAPACMQSPRILEWYRDVAEKFGATRDVYDDLDVSEDCLYLNIWTPTLDPHAKLPVMVYIHGGSNNSGWSYEPNYHGHALAERDVVVVTVAYRLGAFGFLSHPELGGSDAVANFGLHDQLAALEWINEHIARFGGDTSRITLFGESAGAENILALMFIDESGGLFQRAILQSTAGFGLDGAPTLENEEARGAALAAAFGLPVEGSLETLRRVAADDLLKVYEANFDDHYHSPAVDGQLLDEAIWLPIVRGELPDIPVIIGTNANEWHEAVATDPSDDDVREAAAKLAHIDEQVALEAVRDETDLHYALDRLATADLMLCPSQFLASQLTANGGHAWVYQFTRVRDGPGGDAMRAYHGAELPYVFDTHDDWFTTSDVDRELTRAITRYWLTFAATGNPNGATTPAWPDFVAQMRFSMQELGDQVQMVPRIEARLCGSFDANVSRP